MTNGKNMRNGKRTYGTSGMMPNANIGGKVVSEVLKATGIKKQITKTASAVTVPLALLALVMLPSIAQALSLIASAASLAFMAFMGYKVLKAKGIMGGDSVGGIQKNRSTISAEELEARKARAYSFNPDGTVATQGRNTSMTVN